VVQKFLDKTFSIFMQQENFFRKINLHIIQCDAEIQEVAKITDKTEFEDYMRNLEFKGFGGTDFRPVFEYVDRMIEAKEFEDLKGLIYFTDGNGTYPKRRPPYETAFIFVDDDEFEYQVPSWAMKLVLETGDITEEVLI
jgi:predicted metal-dependent peptidase